MLRPGESERRGGLRRLDDILESLEQLNLHDKTDLPDHVAEALVMLGIEQPHSIPIPQLIERVWAMQQPYLITILVDPVDGSLNAKQGLPLFGVMLAVLDGPVVEDTYAGLVLNISTGEEWKAIRKQGVWRAGKPLTVMKRSGRDRIELLGLESTP